MRNNPLFKSLFLVVFVLPIFLLSACSTKIGQPVNDPSVRSILILPVKNESDNDQVEKVFPAVLHYVFAERGYYVFSPRLVRTVLDHHDLLADDSFRNASPEELAALFGADAVMYFNVKAYNVSTAVVYTWRRIGLTYEIYNKNGKLIHKDAHYVKLSLDPDTSVFNPFGTALDGITAALEKDGPINAMQAVTSVSYDFAPGPFHDSSFGWTLRVPFQDKIILKQHPRDEGESRITTDREPDNI